MVNNCRFNNRYQTPYSRQNNCNARNTFNTCNNCDSCNTCDSCSTCNSCNTCDSCNACNSCDSCNNRNSCDVCDRKQLFENIRAYAFAIIDIGLYLDTNPECEFALEYYNTYRDLHKEAVEMYEANYGPLSIYGNEDDDRWKWNCAPWPWEGGDC